MKSVNYYFDSTVGKCGKHSFRERTIYKGIKVTYYGSSCRSKTEAYRKYIADREAKISAIEQGIDYKAGRVKICDGMKIWYERYMCSKVTQGRIRKQSTIDTDMTQLKLFWKALGNIYVCDISNDQLQDYFNDLALQGKNERIRRQWLLLSQFMRYARPHNNPLQSCKKPQSIRIKMGGVVNKLAYDDIAMEILSLELKYTPKGKDYQQALIRGKMLCVIMWQFLRIGEAQELRVKDVDFKNNMLRIVRQYDEARKEVGEPKDGSRRHMPISEHCLGILREACQGKKSEEFVFPGNSCNKHGGRALRSAIRNTLTAACVSAGLERHTIHDLRHDGISYYVRAGASPQAIQRWAGHKSIQVTLDIYYRDTGKDTFHDIAVISGRKVNDQNLDETAQPVTDILEIESF